MRLISVAGVESDFDMTAPPVAAPKLSATLNRLIASWAAAPAAAMKAATRPASEDMMGSGHTCNCAAAPVGRWEGSGK